MSKKKTHIEYENELLEKELDCFPLEKYNGAHIKITHECVLGHNWLAAPHEVLKSKGCPKCSLTRAKTHEEYVNELIDSNIKYIPLERYKSAKTKILHLCPKGHEWEVRPKDILEGQGCRICNCKGLYNDKLFLKNPDLANSPGILYLIKLLGKDKPVCLKIGITTNLKSRFKSYKHIEIVKTYSLALKICYGIEQAVLDNCEAYNSDTKFGGYKELLTLSSETKVLDVINKYISED